MPKSKEQELKEIKERVAFYHRRHRAYCLKITELIREITDLKMEIEKLRK
ncbi:unnamed protein product [marine sediment metagenome]|uniref:Uncharacterized protein n=1 Tax=marine sediment metagenome TaxID=412755 RepID=X1G5Z9_9ZZZZ